MRRCARNSKLLQKFFSALVFENEKVVSFEHNFSQITPLKEAAERPEFI